MGPDPAEFEFPDPAFRMRDEATGVPVTLADGREWLLADGGLGNALDDLRDRIYDESEMEGSVLSADIQQCAWMMLWVNYNIDEHEAARLIIGVRPERITEAVCEALFGPVEPARSYTAWAKSSLQTAGLDPSSLSSKDRQLVLELLVATGRAIPCRKFCESSKAAGQRAQLRALARGNAPGG